MGCTPSVVVNSHATQDSIIFSNKPCVLKLSSNIVTKKNSEFRLNTILEAKESMESSRDH